MQGYWKSIKFFFVTVDRRKKDKFLEHPIARHVGLLVMFALFNIILPSSDFITDILTSQTFFQQGHYYWGTCTMLFVFLPFMGRFAMFFWSIFKCLIKSKSEDYPNKMTELKVLGHESPELIWHFPPLIILRSVKK